MRWTVLLLAVALASPAAGQGAKQSSPLVSDTEKLKPGEFVWTPQLAPTGPMVMVVSLKAQQAAIYRNGVRIGATTVSTGKTGHETPTGVFTILQKKEKHNSNLYNNASMPYMQRLTWDGIALHAGNLPGRPASHGCIRLPLAFSKLLFGATEMGMTVVITDEPRGPTRLDSGDILAPVTDTGASTAALAAQRLAKDEAYRWRPQVAPTGPVTIVISALDQRAIVMRNGKVIGRGKVRIPAGRVLGTHALTFTGFDAQGLGRWIYLGVPGQELKAGQALDMSGVSQMQVPPEYLTLIRSVLKPGTTLLATSGSLLGGGAGKPVNLIESEGT
jgi:hypothetical protein